MKNEIFDFFPFKLGEQYDNWEFDLLATGEVLENEISYEIYEFVGEFPTLFDIKPSKIELLFNADVLEKVIYYFNGNLTEHFEQLFSDSGQSFNTEISYMNLENQTLISYSRHFKG